MVTSELYEVHLSNGGRSRTAAACSGVEFRNGSQLISNTIRKSFSDLDLECLNGQKLT